jgi:hypothetical protein
VVEKIIEPTAVDVLQNINLISLVVALVVFCVGAIVVAMIEWWRR